MKFGGNPPSLFILLFNKVSREPLQLLRCRSFNTKALVEYCLRPIQLAYLLHLIMEIVIQSSELFLCNLQAGTLNHLPFPRDSPQSELTIANNLQHSIVVQRSRAYVHKIAREARLPVVLE